MAVVKPVVAAVAVLGAGAVAVLDNPERTAAAGAAAGARGADARARGSRGGARRA